MLQQLRIENFALIEKLSLTIAPGLNILTGETGAGKSIILDALDVALGGKVSSRMIRTGTDRALIEASFHASSQLIAWLTAEEIPVSATPMVTCQREITAKSNRTRVNSTVVNKQQIQFLREQLVEITAQGQTVLLGRPAMQRDWLDNFGGEKLLQLRDRVKQCFAVREKSRLALLDRQKREETRLQQIDVFQYQLQELDGAELEDPEEMTKLEQERKRLSYAVELQQQSYQVYEMLYQSDQGIACVDILGQAEATLSEMTTLDEELTPILEMVQEALAQIAEAGRQINSYGSQLETDPDRLSYVETRLRQLKQICRKYGPTLPEAIANVERLRAQLGVLTEEEQPISVLEQKAKEDEALLLRTCQELTLLRQQSARSLEKQLVTALQSLAMEKVQFQVQITPTAPTSEGHDQITFLFSPNPGEPLQPLAEIASGGEMSRFLLALKTCFASSDPIGTLVFDEIDVGVSGRVAQAIAYQLYQISRSHQVLCVTHQPIVAAIADHHYQVSKKVTTETQEGQKSRQRTTVSIKLLELEDRKQELAQIAGGVDITAEDTPAPKRRSKNKPRVSDSAIAFAESLLEQADRLKQQGT